MRWDGGAARKVAEDVNRGWRMADGGSWHWPWRLCLFLVRSPLCVVRNQPSAMGLGLGYGAMGYGLWAIRYPLSAIRYLLQSSLLMKRYTIASTPKPKYRPTSATSISKPSWKLTIPLAASNMIVAASTVKDTATAASVRSDLLRGSLTRCFRGRGASRLDEVLAQWPVMTVETEIDVLDIDVRARTDPPSTRIEAHAGLRCFWRGHVERLAS